MPVLVVSGREVPALLPMSACIEAMGGVLAALAEGRAAMPLRTVLRLPPGGRNAFALMPAVLDEIGAAPARAGAKIITVFPGNDATPYDSHQGVVLLFEMAHGQLLAIIDASSVTAIRTAAVSGLATRLLARPDATELALLGSGVQAATHLEAMLAVRSLRKVRVWSRTPEHAAAFVATSAARYSLPIIQATSAREAVTGADIVCTVTASREPVLEGAWVADGTHVNAVGASTPDGREVDSALVARARLFVDRMESALREPGDLLTPLADGTITPDHIVGEIGTLVRGEVIGRRSPHEVTMFKSLGLAVEDVAAAQAIDQQAVATGRGTWLDLGGERETHA